MYIKPFIPNPILIFNIKGTSGYKPQTILSSVADPGGGHRGHMLPCFARTLRLQLAMAACQAICMCEIDIALLLVVSGQVLAILLKKEC